MAHEIRVALQIAQRFSHQYASSPTRLWFPRVSLAWFGVSPGSFISDDPHSYLGSSSRDAILDTEYAGAEFKQGLHEHVFRVDVRKSATKAAILRTSKGPSGQREDRIWISWWRRLKEKFWASREVLKLRIRLWRFLQATRHSSHLRHAVKASVGVAVLTFPAYLPSGSPGSFLTLVTQLPLRSV
jgi:hypothetical protein